MKQVQLTLDGDVLLLDGELFLFQYPAGDCDVLTKDDIGYKLYSCLYDMVNTGELEDDTEVLLPSGEVFGYSAGCHFIASNPMHEESLFDDEEEYSFW